MKGQLRLAVIGPGAMSDYEREVLDSIVENPTKILALDSAQKSALKYLRGTLASMTRNKIASSIDNATIPDWLQGEDMPLDGMYRDAEFHGRQAAPPQTNVTPADLDEVLTERTVR